MGLLFNKVLLDDLYRYEGDRSRFLGIKLRYLFCAWVYVYFFLPPYIYVK